MVGNCYLEVLPGRTGVVAWLLPRVLPGVTWCYLECYLVLPGRYLDCYLGKVFISRWRAVVRLKIGFRN